MSHPNRDPQGGFSGHGQILEYQDVTVEPVCKFHSNVGSEYYFTVLPGNGY